MLWAGDILVDVPVDAAHVLIKRTPPRLVCGHCSSFMKMNVSGEGLRNYLSASLPAPLSLAKKINKVKKHIRDNSKGRNNAHCVISEIMFVSSDGIN